MERFGSGFKRSNIVADLLTGFEDPSAIVSVLFAGCLVRGGLGFRGQEGSRSKEQRVRSKEQGSSAAGEGTYKGNLGMKDVQPFDCKDAIDCKFSGRPILCIESGEGFVLLNEETITKRV
jgi:hypothetical protein